ncbi:alpha/beta hydrolase [uncultured Corynebacterium sp.]|uniref:alpha/beta hydrolase n=1 Tax=uncultured Corynebacterium sp. TaxID=159447 RepID=UPI0025984575|nr:alpha/beta hydrolase [uncultured Corynebacterium sp.]
MRKPLEQGSLDDAYPENVQGTPEFNVGGVERLLPEQLQMEQIVSYMEATYPVDGEPSDTYLARLPDRLTHAAMLMLGSAVDHTMPGVAFPGDVSAEDVELGALFTPSRPSGAWAVSCAPALGPQAREHAWHPEVAGVAELSGVTILDVADAADIPAAVEYARARGAASVALWALGNLPRAEADSYVATFPEAEVSAAENVLVQTRGEYFTTGWVSTPAQARRRVADVAEFLRAGA